MINTTKSIKEQLQSLLERNLVDEIVRRRR